MVGGNGLILVTDGSAKTVGEGEPGGASPTWSILLPLTVAVGTSLLVASVLILVRGPASGAIGPNVVLGTYRSPAAATWPPPDNGVYTPRLTKMLGNDIGFTTWMSDGLRVLDLRHPATPKLGGHLRSARRQRRQLVLRDVG